MRLDGENGPCLIEPHKSNDGCCAPNANDTIRISCGRKILDVVRCSRLTLEELKWEVAQFMPCEPNQLHLVATDMDFDLRTHGSGVDFEVWISSAHYMHFRYVDSLALNAEKDSMEGVQYSDSIDAGHSNVYGLPDHGMAR